MLLPTHCMLPDGAGVSVAIRPTQRGWHVSDDACVWEHLLSVGIEPTHFRSRAKTIAERRGLNFAAGAFAIEDVADGQVHGAILWVANAAQEWGSAVLKGGRKRLEIELRAKVIEACRSAFGADRVKADCEVLGASTRAYEVAAFVRRGESSLIIEPVAHHPTALATTYTKLTDVGRAHPTWERQVVIADSQAWQSDELALLADATTVPVSDLNTFTTRIGRT